MEGTKSKSQVKSKQKARNKKIPSNKKDTDSNKGVAKSDKKQEFRPSDTFMSGGKDKSNSKFKRNVLVMAIVGVVFVLIASVAMNVASRNSSKTLGEAYETCIGDKFKSQDFAEYFNSNSIVLKLEDDDTLSERLTAIKCIAREVGSDTIKESILNAVQDGDPNTIYSDGNFAGFVSTLTSDKMAVALYEVRGEESQGELSAAVDICTNIYADGDSSKSSSGYNFYGNSTQKTTYGSMRIADGGKTLIYSGDSSDSLLRERCMYKVLAVPERILNAIGNTSALDGQQTDHWGDYTIKWSYRSGDTDISIYEY